MGDIGPTQQRYEVLAVPSETVPASMLTSVAPDGTSARRDPGKGDGRGEPPAPVDQPAD